MIPIRVWFQKKGEARYISHLDLNRFMLRALKRSRLPVWHTEGFNPHIYVTFALPLPLGQCSDCEIMDFRLVRPVEHDAVLTALSAVLPRGLAPVKAASPVHKAKEIVYSSYEVELPCGAALAESIHAFLEQENIPAEKKTKKGTVKSINLKEVLADYSVVVKEKGALLSLTLPAGSQNNINPALYLAAMAKELPIVPEEVIITRKGVFDANRKPFA